MNHIPFKEIDPLNKVAFVLASGLFLETLLIVGMGVLFGASSFPRRRIHASLCLPVRLNVRAEERPSRLLACPKSSKGFDQCIVRNPGEGERDSGMIPNAIPG